MPATELDRLATPEAFFERFIQYSAPPPFRPNSKRPEWTQWCEGHMQAIAGASAHCQNHDGEARNVIGTDRAPGRVSGEWLQVDHVFVEKNSWTDFPKIVVEHENEDISWLGDGHRLPEPTDRKSRVEWALWKVLAVRSRLSVLIAYPFEERQVEFLERMALIAGPWRAGLPPSDPQELLVIAGWWPSGRRISAAEFKFSGYRLASGKLEPIASHAPSPGAAG